MLSMFLRMLDRLSGWLEREARAEDERERADFARRHGGDA